MKKKQDMNPLLLDKLDETLARLDRFQAKLDIVERNFDIMENEMGRYHSAVVVKFEEMQERIKFLEAQIEYLLDNKTVDEHPITLQ
ncbi:hypothetical protein ACFFJY_03800 [Fictibacillus aquaticus]|uniref:Uncharacterized protein n=1 Tax=Fictibacillus aquaticus TaxID=2021314 RepID=A0A235F515_9BACL|nr:hypothetical protein [Fictibacillus aquaticus]OYD56340.1 hypothetical protein CGZ90_17930 [Fictibacillus aquaticus]